MMIIIMLSVTLFAQQDVTTFLGIPVDGSKSEMIRKLKEKGFRSSTDEDADLTGEFNGKTVYIRIVTNNTKFGVL